MACAGLIRWGCGRGLASKVEDSTQDMFPQEGKDRLGLGKQDGLASRMRCSVKSPVMLWVGAIVRWPCLPSSFRKVKPAEAETAGAIMAFFLSLGLALGAVFSFLFRAIV